MKYFEVFSVAEIWGIIYLFSDRLMSMCNILLFKYILII